MITKKTLKDNNALMSIKKKHLLICNKLLATNQYNFSVVDVIDNLKLKNCDFYNTQLWTIILDAEVSKIAEIKGALLQKDIYFNDGYENINFSSAFFNRPYHYKTYYNNKSDHIEQASFFIRVISFETYIKNYKNIDKPDTFITTNAPCFFENVYKDDMAVQFYALSEVESLSELYSILK